MMAAQIREKGASYNANRDRNLKSFSRIPDSSKHASVGLTVRRNMREFVSAINVETEEKIAKGSDNPSAHRLRPRSQASGVKGSKPASEMKNVNVKKNATRTLSLALENQAIKRQKPDGGRSRQILDVELPQPVHRKLGLSCNLDVGSTQKEAREINQWKPQPTAPKTTVLQTSIRLRSTLRSSFEVEKIPKFKARPLNKKIFESKGEMGLLYHAKKEVTIPKEFHFATSERFPLPTAVADLFGEVPPTPETKACTKLPLKSLAKRKEEMKGERMRTPLTEVNQFNLHRDNRAIYKTDFEHKMEEEKTLKQLRTIMATRSRSVSNFSNPFFHHKSCKGTTTKANLPNLRALQSMEKPNKVNTAAASMR